MVSLIENVVSLVENFAVAAQTDPISALMFAFGALFIGAASAAFGVLALGGLLSPLVPETATRPKQT